jgi:hypothetical protein
MEKSNKVVKTVVRKATDRWHHDLIGWKPQAGERIVG